MGVRLKVIESGPLKGRVRVHDFAKAAGVTPGAVRYWGLRGDIQLLQPEKQATIDGAEAAAWFAPGGGYERQRNVPQVEGGE